MIKEKIKQIILMILILNLIILSSIIIKAISCEEIEGKIECEIPIKISINDEKPIQMNIIKINLQNNTIRGMIEIINENSENKDLELYYYVYFRNKCLSCESSRNETIKKVSIKSNEKNKIPFELNLKEIETYPEFKFKLKYKEIKYKTWKDITIDLTNNNNNNSTDIYKSDNEKTLIKKKTNSNNSNKSKDNNEEFEINQSKENLTKSKITTNNLYDVNKENNNNEQTNIENETNKKNILLQIKSKIKSKYFKTSVLILASIGMIIINKPKPKKKKKRNTNKKNKNTQQRQKKTN